METQQASAVEQYKTHRHEGPRKHILSFVISLVLTFLAFAAVMNANLSKTFVLTFIVFLAIVQVVVQLLFWMHMKDKGHMMPAIFIIGGSMVALSGVVTALNWIWW